MRYSEMLGLPGAGKTTALRSISRRDFVAFRTGSFFDRRRVVVRASSRVSHLLDPPSARLRAKLGDYWGSSVIASHIHLFSRVLQLVERIPEGSRQRAIILNYWRERVARYILVSEAPSRKMGLTDEGLLQTLLSTVIRTSHLDPDDSTAIALVSQIIEALPHIDVVYHFNVGRDIIEQRRSKSQLHWALEQRTEDWLARLIALSVQEGLNVRNVDANLRAPEIQHQLKAPAF